MICHVCKREDLPVVPGLAYPGAVRTPCAHARADGTPCPTSLGAPADEEWTALVWSDDAWWDLGEEAPVLESHEAPVPDALKLPPLTLPPDMMRKERNRIRSERKKKPRGEPVH